MDHLPLPAPAWYERGIALGGAVSMAAVGALALWAVLAGTPLPNLEAAIGEIFALPPPALADAGAGAAPAASGVLLDPTLTP